MAHTATPRVGREVGRAWPDLALLDLRGRRGLGERDAAVVTRSPSGAPAGGSTNSTRSPDGCDASGSAAQHHAVALEADELLRFEVRDEQALALHLLGVKCGRSPDAIWRGSSSPHEISSQNSLSASSWHHTLVTWPTLNSSCVQTGAAASEAGSGAGGGFAFSGLGFFGAARSALRRRAVAVRAHRRRPTPRAVDPRVEIDLRHLI